ncbi:unnamed protein product [Paramecium sonneborni]|uniref:Uncharacterized protein n=1 Tax=Paramecium sonneborni TaxID=65129 RepID=A0A8S1KIK2_9CILI|nr:unnamed protein product [Paramecium sonneborni]
MEFMLDYYFYYRFLITTNDQTQRKQMLQNNYKCFLISTSFFWLYFWSKSIQLRPTTIFQKSICYGFILSTIQASYYGTPKLDRFLCRQQQK